MKKCMYGLCAVIIGCSFLMSSAAFALDGAQQQKRGMMGMHCISRWEMFRFIKNMNITDEQKDALKALKDDTDNQTKPLATQLVELQDEMTDTLLAADIDTATAEANIDSMLALQTQIADILLHAQLAAVQILTAEQRALILDMVNQLRECADGYKKWSGVNKPAYFSLLMPEKAF